MKKVWILVSLFVFMLGTACEKEVTPAQDISLSAKPSSSTPIEPIEEKEELSEQEVANEEEERGEDSEVTDDVMPYEIDVLADGLNVPWEMDIAPDGRIFFTERPGVIRVIDASGKLVNEPVFQFEAPFISKSEGGLLGLVLDPAFAENHYLYVYHTYRERGEIKNRVLRLIEADNKAVIDTVLIDNLPGASNHNGGRIKIGPDGYLYITAGDRYEPPLAQDVKSLGGKILRIALDGSIPSDNPIPDSPIYSLGHRNAQGLAWHPVTKQLYASEHGQTAHDEINVIDAGANYGWPIIEGDETSKDAPHLRPPILHSGNVTWAPSGMTFVTKGPWKGKLLVANLRGEQVLQITLNEKDLTKVEHVEYLFQDWGRIRNVYEAKDGTLYIMTNNRDGRGNPSKEDDKIYRLRLKK